MLADDPLDRPELSSAARSPLLTSTVRPEGHEVVLLRQVRALEAVLVFEASVLRLTEHKRYER